MVMDLQENASVLVNYSEGSIEPMHVASSE